MNPVGPPVNATAAGRGLSMSVEPRYNLATKIMSNGVEVIVAAGDRTARPADPEFLRLLSSTVTRPITLAPHTLSHHMSMLLPADLKVCIGCLPLFFQVFLPGHETSVRSASYIS